MQRFSRRSLFSAAGLGLAGFPEKAAEAAPEKPLPLSRYEPRSMLHVAETHIDRARFPLIDMHTHLSRSAKNVNGVALAAERIYSCRPEDALTIMDARNIRAMVNLTGGYGAGLKETIARFDTAHPGRFYTLTEPWYSRLLDPDYPKFQAQAIADAHAAGAKGLKILKTLGLYLRENITTGTLVKVDDRRFDSMWDACGQLGMPVFMHVSDPVAFFTPIDRFNERWEELHEHPDWSFYGRDFPGNADILEARNRVIARHPRTQFLTLHVGNFSEDLADVSRNLDRFQNMSVEIAARISELGRQPRTARRFFDKYQDRIMFGTDSDPRPQDNFVSRMYAIYFRFLETEDEYFDYAPARIPPQGRWRIYGIGLPDEILRRVYHENAARLLQLSL